jgi:hypothetical protein
MVNGNNLVAPTIGIRDVGADEEYLFLFRRKEEWVASCDSMINKCHESRDSPSLERDNEEEEVDGDIDDVADEDDVDEVDVDEEDVDEEDDNYDVADKDVDDNNDADNKEEDSVGEDDVIGSQDADEVVAQPQTNKKKRRRY